MEISAAIALLKRLLDDVPRLRRLASQPKNPELPAWDKEIVRIIKDTFGSDSKELMRYDGSHLLRRVNSQQEQVQAYNDHISQREDALRDIIQEYDKKQEAHSEKMTTILDDLKQTYENFIRYKEMALAKRQGTLSSDKDKEFSALSVQVQRQIGSLKQIIEKYGGPSIVLLEGGNYRCEALTSAFNITLFGSDTLITVLDTALTTLNMAIGKLGRLNTTTKQSLEIVIEDGRTYDAYKTIRDIIGRATKKLIIVDSYIDSTLFTLLENAQPNLEIQILTKEMQGDSKLVGEKYKAQYESKGEGTLEIRTSSKSHDRFIMADNNIFHLGASIKDAGRKLCAITEFEGTDTKKELCSNIDSYWSDAGDVL